MEKSTIRAMRSDHTFDQRLNSIQIIFADAKDRILSELKDDTGDVFMDIIVKCMQIVFNTKILVLHDFEQHELIIDLVKDIVKSMAISDDEKAELIATGFPAISNIVNILTASAKGHLYLRHKSLATKAKTKATTKTTGSRAPEDPVDMNALIDDVYNTLKTVIRLKEVTLSNIVVIGSTVMQILEEYPQLAGFQKKMLTLSVLHKLIDEIDVDENTRALLKVMIDTTVSKTIDFIIKASRGEIEFINEIVNNIKGCFAKCKKNKVNNN